jgi:SAM-dependent methyltransferase
MHTLTPHEFVDKWKRVTAREKQIYQEHFLDLCYLVGHQTPNDLDPTGKQFGFEMGAAKTSGGQGWADVAKLGFFGWEYKAKHADLDKAYEQLLLYRDALKNPPLLVVSDIDHIIIRTNYVNFSNQTYTITLDDILNPESLRILKLVFFDPEQLKPKETVESVTTEAATKFARLADNLRKYGHDNQVIAHFLIRLLFCLFAEDIGLLPEKMFPRLLAQTRRNSKDFGEVLSQLFRAMKTGGYFGSDKILYFNGGLFDDDSVLPLDGADMDIIANIDALDWGAIEPSIFGTLFERGLDPSKRSQLGGHFTGKDDIVLIVEPVLMAPLRREWEELQAECKRLKQDAETLTGRKRSDATEKIGRKLRLFADRIASIKILDPACGSGNFLYIALRLLLDLQNDVISFSDEMGAGRFFISVTPAQLYGIEINEYAYELAQMTIQIGYIQWLRDNGYGFPQEPILRQVKNIRHMDAVLAYDENGKPVEPEWPEVDVIVGNPPFLGGNKIRAELGDKYVEDLFNLYGKRVPAFADLVCYWFERARAMIDVGRAKQAGLLATNSIRGGVNRKVLERIKETGDIFWAQSDRDWVLDGAAVHVSMIGFDGRTEKDHMLDGRRVATINSDLSSLSDLTMAKPLPENADIAFIGDTKKGQFDITHEVAVEMLQDQANPNGQPNSDVIKPWINGLDITNRPRNMWIIDFGVDMPQHQAAQYEKPFEYVRRNVKPSRDMVRNEREKKYWWLHGRPAPDLRLAIKGLEKYIASARVAKYRLFRFISASTIPDGQVVVIAREDDYFLGVLHSRPHEIWSLKLGTSLEDRPRYSQSLTFETFPFPYAPGKEPQDNPCVRAIAQAAKDLVEQRDNWLRAEGLSEAEKKKHTLTNLYNKRPTWLDLAHKKLDEAVFAAYGWKADMSDEEIVAKLLELNLERCR